MWLARGGDPVLLPRGSLPEVDPLGFFVFGLLRAGSASPWQPLHKKNTSGFDNVGFIGPENINGSKQRIFIRANRPNCPFRGWLLRR
jgi:hypothetical protein